MGLFRKKCPLESSMESWGLAGMLEALPTGKARCQLCRYRKVGKCRYNKIMAKEMMLDLRGAAALAKETVYTGILEKGLMFDRETVNAMEQAGLSLSGLKREEKKEYWEISKAYDEEWINTSPEKRREILLRVHQWRMFMEDGYSPKQASELANELDYSSKPP